MAPGSTHSDSPSNRARRFCGNRRPGCALALLILILGSCQEPFSLEELVDGPDGKALTVSPTSAVLQINDTLPIATSGGIPPYSYRVISGLGGFSGNLYEAPPTPGSERIRVTDSVGASEEASFIINGVGLALGITPSTQTLFTGDSLTLNPIGGTAPFTFDFPVGGNNSGAILVGSSYTAGSQAGVDQVEVLDGAADTSIATITVLAKPFSISPDPVTVYVNQTLSFNVVGGDGPFTFDFPASGNNSGAMLTVGGSYIAGPIPQTDTIRVTDAYDGRSRTATVTVVDIASSVDYIPGPVINIAPGNQLAGSSFDAEFTVDNAGSAAGSKPLSWTLYASTDESIGGPDDRIAATGTVASPPGAGSSTGVTVSGGTWPSEAGDYYLLVEVYAADDLTPGNNRNQSAGSTSIYEPLSISPAVASVYTGQEIDFTVTGGTGSYSYVFTQSDSGSPSVAGDLYTAGASPGIDILEISDDLFPAWLPASATVTVAATPPPPPGNVEYVVLSFTSANPTPDAGSSIGESFTVQNTGLDDGTDSLNWAVYLSQNDTLGFTAGDQLIDTGFRAPLDGDDGLPGGSDEAILAVVGNWSITAGDRYLKVREWADDETTPDQWFASGAFAVQLSTLDIDYTVSTAPAGGGYQVGNAISESFMIENQGGNAGSADIDWYVYSSADPFYSAGDTLIDSDSYAGGLGAGGTTGIGVDGDLVGGTWPAAGSYYLIVRLQAADETNSSNNLASSGLYTISDPVATTPDYLVGGVSMYAPNVTTGSSVSETFTIQNIGSNGGNDVDWTAYASLDTIPDAGEEIGNGSTSALTGGSSRAGITAFGVWPATPGSYYLIVTETAPDETLADRNDLGISPARFTVADPPDYEVQGVSYPLEVEASTAIGGDFQIHNGGTGDGKRNIQWEAFLSYDEGFSASDLLLGSGEVGALAVGNSATIDASELDFSNWPNYGLSYLLIRISADDDGDESNDEYISPVREIYLLDSEGADNLGASNDGSGKKIGAITPSQSVGTLERGQTLVIKGWLDSFAHDTYSFVVGAGVTSVSTFATWSSGFDSGDLYLWDELNNEFGSWDVTPNREPTSNTLSVSGWIAPEVGYVGIDSYENAPVGNEFPYTIYISGDE